MSYLSLCGSVRTQKNTTQQNGQCKHITGLNSILDILLLSWNCIYSIMGSDLLVNVGVSHEEECLAGFTMGFPYTFLKISSS